MKKIILPLLILIILAMGCRKNDDNDTNLSYNQIAVKYDWVLVSICDTAGNNVHNPHYYLFDFSAYDAYLIRFVNDSSLAFKIYNSPGELCISFTWKIIKNSTLMLGNESTTIQTWNKEKLVYIMEFVGQGGSIKKYVFTRKSVK
jgi:hypothetical protein